MSFLWWGKPKKEVEPYDDPLSPYDDGQQAARDGLEQWENKYALPSGDTRQFAHWNAGWCYGKQLIKAGK